MESSDNPLEKSPLTHMFTQLGNAFIYLTVLAVGYVLALILKSWNEKREQEEENERMKRRPMLREDFMDHLEDSSSSEEEEDDDEEEEEEDEVEQQLKENQELRRRRIAGKSVQEKAEDKRLQAQEKKKKKSSQVPKGLQAIAGGGEGEDSKYIEKDKDGNVKVKNPLDVPVEKERARWADMHNAMLSKFLEKRPEAKDHLRPWRDSEDEDDAEDGYDEDMQELIRQYGGKRTQQEESEESEREAAQEVTFQKNKIDLSTEVD